MFSHEKLPKTHKTTMTSKLSKKVPVLCCGLLLPPNSMHVCLWEGWICHLWVFPHSCPMWYLVIPTQETAVGYSHLPGTGLIQSLHLAWLENLPFIAAAAGHVRRVCYLVGFHFCCTWCTWALAFFCTDFIVTFKIVCFREESLVVLSRWIAQFF